ncbi:transcription antitermination factor NusB [Helicobacter sp.]|uniref:transcription antitermination factor NusB n=1 Tax=Helicobacter sp. TaxID=218 RepID=UPI002A7475F9|nr:transcription antitermination factor NusB [Helicobacter sp.]MDY2585355.1 transcription antitermination factor NusB [Helicobacter sp.]
MATRTQAREVVAQLLYAYGSGNDGIAKFVDEILSEQKIKNAQSAFAKSLFNGVLEELDALDLRIKHQIKNWDFERIGDMERAILRLGAYEIIFSKTERAIVINEALEITKNFSNEASTKFINGILDGIANNATMSLEDIKEALQESQKEEQVVRSVNNAPKEKFFKNRKDYKTGARRQNTPSVKAVSAKKHFTIKKTGK